MQTSRVARVAAILLFLLTFFSHNVSAIDPPSAPSTVIIDLLDFRANASAGQWIATLNISIELPPTFNETTWTWLVNASPVNTGDCGDSLCWSETNPAAPHAAIPIAERPGWAWLGTFSNLLGNEQYINTPTWGMRNLTIKAYVSGTPGTPSCSTTVDFWRLDSGMYLGPVGGMSGFDDGTFTTLTHRVPNEAGQPSYFACGTNTTLRAPSGVGAVVNNSYQTGNGTSDVNVTWRASPNDPTFGLDYYVLRHYNNPPVKTSTLYWQLDSTTDGLDTPNKHSKIFVGDGLNGTVDQVWFRVLARDPYTHQRSDESCIVSVVQGRNNSAANCGNLAIDVFGSTIAPDPILPNLNVPQWSAAMGWTTTEGSFFISLIVLSLCALCGFMLAKAHGALFLGSVGLMAVTVWGLLPLWVLILAFTAFVGSIVLSKRGQSA